MSTDMAPVYQASEANTCLYTMPFLALEMGHLLSFNMMPHLEKKRKSRVCVWACECRRPWRPAVTLGLGLQTVMSHQHDCWGLNPDPLQEPCAGEFYVNLTQNRIVWKRGILFEKTSSQDLPTNL